MACFVVAQRIWCIREMRLRPISDVRLKVCTLLGLDSWVPADIAATPKHKSHDCENYKCTHDDPDTNANICTD